MTIANSTLDKAAPLARRVPQASRAEELLEALPDDLIYVLARLHGQPSDVIAVALSTLRYGSRTTLAEAEVIEGVPSNAEGGGQVTLTGFGKEVIAACASSHGPDAAEEQRAKKELANAHQEWVDSNPAARSL
jgi:hypothetical protein